MTKTPTTMPTGPRTARQIQSHQCSPRPLSHIVLSSLQVPWGPVPLVVQMLTQRNAAHMGLSDRGVIAPGMKADINLIDYNKLGLSTPLMTYDLPAGGRRLVQHASGYEATFVSGEMVMERGKATGALPGRLVRA